MAKKLKALSKQMLALMLIKDPVARARAAAQLYKQFAQVAKDYAGATAGGGDAAAAANAANAAGASANGTPPAAAATDPATQDAASTAQTAAASGTSANGTTDGTATPATTGDATPPATTAPPATPTDPASPSTAANGDGKTTAAGAATATTPAVTPLYVTGHKSNFVADVYMEEIKVFAGAAKQIYDSAVQEARMKHVDKSKLQGLDKEMEDSKKTLTEAAQAVEGPAATADGYDPTGAATSSPPTTASPVVNLTA